MSFGVGVFAGWRGMLVNHLWQSTAVVLLLWAMSVGLRRHRASLRYRLWMAASLKFVIPFSLLVAAGRALQPRVPSVAPVAHFGGLVLRSVQPYPQTLAGVVGSGSTAAGGWGAERLLVAGCLGLWALGAGVLLASWLRGLRSLQAIARQAQACGMIDGVPILRSLRVAEPGVFGIFRPVLLMPADLLDRLSALELEAIYAHELAHVQRRDNLTATLHAVVHAAFWFHPAVWLIRARLMEEREHACDEAVLASGSDAEVYARSILDVCRFSVGAQTGPIAGVAGGRLKQRLLRIVADLRYAPLRRRQKLLMAALAALIVSLPVAAGLVNAGHVQAQDQKLAFEVASIRPDPDVNGMSMGWAGTTWSAKGTTIVNLLMGAFDLKHFQIVNAPGWATSEQFTIRARIPDTNLQLPEKERSEQYPPMMQSLLEERFHLRYHWVEQVRPVYSLVVSKSGPKLTKSKPDDKGELQIGPGYFEGHGMPIQMLADNLGGNLDYIVQDRTGLKGNYDFSIHFVDPDSKGGPTDEDDLSNPAAQARCLAALQEQLGLQLVAEKRPVRMLVIDQVERPTPN